MNYSIWNRLLSVHQFYSFLAPIFHTYAIIMPATNNSGVFWWNAIPTKQWPIGYYSRTITDSGRIYNSSERECLAIAWEVLLLRHYLYGTRFEIRADHDSLKWLVDLSSQTWKLARCRLRLKEYDFEVFYRPGIKQLTLDGLSRLDTDGNDETDIDDDITVLSLTKADEKEIKTFNIDDDPVDYKHYPLPND